jgi:hypothetical protein
MKDQYRREQSKIVKQIGAIGLIVPRFIKDGEVRPAHPTAARRLKNFQRVKEELAA